MTSTPPIDAPALADERIAHVVRHVARAFQTCLERRLAEHGVNFGFWAYLRVLWKEDGLSQRVLSERVGLTGPTTHSVIQRMMAAGLVEMRPVTPGKPRRAVYLSAHGQALRDTLEPLAEDVNAMSLRGLGTGDVAQLRAWLLQINDNLSGTG